MFSRCLPVASCNVAGHVAREWALQGLGATCLIPAAVKEEENRGEPTRLLTGWSEQGVDIPLIMPARQLPHRLRVFIDYLAAYCAKLPD